ncbi:hypothetical protein PybrP1_012512 [[Pythium] brassicae (nom. inval.)]|nr:hypothetical protein PybrP1_012512 [[Pythium] brassicae (nom. inval.)]
MAAAAVLKVENVRVLRGGRLQHTALWVVDGKVTDPQARFWRALDDASFAAHAVVDGGGGIVAPGFIDLQLNGGFGHDFSNPRLAPEHVLEVAQRLVATGVTAFCPTLVSSSADVYRTLADKFPRTADAHTRRAANMLGLHLEGPFINKARKGAHNERHLLAPSHGLRSLEQRYGAVLDAAAIVTLAPELDGAMDAIAALQRRGVVVSAGHSLASIDVAMQAAERGVSMLTHVFNAMGQFHHRDPGLIGLLGLHPARPYYGLILDGLHSHRTSARIIQSCHPDGLVLVTDAMAGLGLPPGEYELAGERVDVRPRGAFLAGTDVLAGSVVTMDSCVRTLIEYTGCSVETALEAATLHPARVLGIAGRKGTLDFGADADFVLLDDQLRVQRTYIAGELVYDATM